MLHAIRYQRQCQVELRILDRVAVIWVDFKLLHHDVSQLVIDNLQPFEEIVIARMHARYYDFFEWLQIVNDELGYIVVKKFEINPNDRDAIKNPKLDLTLTLVSYRMEQNYDS